MVFYLIDFYGKIVWNFHTIILKFTGASNLRPRNIFVRPKLDSEFKEKSVFWPIFLRFLTNCGPKYEKKADLRPKHQPGLDAPVLKTCAFLWSTIFWHPYFRDANLYSVDVFIQYFSSEEAGWARRASKWINTRFVRSFVNSKARVRF
jgi:hypothetical protein